MKLLHTSDLHFGVQWRRQSRREDQARVLAEIIDVCEARDVDALVVTGDVFGDRVEGNSAQVMRQFLQHLRPLFQAGRAVFLLRGNHDSLPLFGLARHLITELQASAGDAMVSPWPLVMADVPDVYQLPIRGGRMLQVVALPYVRPAQMQTVAPVDGTTGEQNVAQLTGLLALYLEGMRTHVAPHLPTIFAAHVMVGGANIKPDRIFESGYDTELWLESASLPQYTSYNALGHIHLGQELRSAGKPTWYAGAPDRLDLGEREYRPQVLLVSIPDGSGGAAQVEPIVLRTCTPFMRVEVDGVHAVEQFLALKATAASEPTIHPLGEVIIAGIPTAARGPIEALLRKSFPRLDVLWAHDSHDPAAAPLEAFDPQDVPSVIASYFDRVYSERPERRGELAAAFETLWQEGSTPETDTGLPNLGASTPATPAIGPQEARA